MKPDSYDHGRTCVPCKDDNVDVSCCILSTFADESLFRVDDKEDARYIVKHGTVACKQEGKNPFLYNTKKIIFETLDNNGNENDTCKMIGMDVGDVACKKDSCSFSLSSNLRDKMADFTSRDRHHVRCGIPDMKSDDKKYTHEFDCCTKVTDETNHPVYACKLDKFASDARILIRGKWNEGDENVCNALGESLSSELKDVPKDMKKRVVPRGYKFKYIKTYNVAGNFVEMLHGIKKDLAYRIKNPPYYLPLKNVLGMELIPGKSGKGCDWSLTEQVHRRIE